MYSIEEKVDMLECYIANKKSPALALREYIRKFPSRQVPEKKVFSRLYIKFKRDGHLSSKTKNRSRQILTEVKQLEILLHFEDLPETSTRQAALDLNMKRTSLRKCLKMHGRKPFKYSLVQRLEERDYHTRFEFCSMLMDMNFADNVFSHILWTDESIFHTSAPIFNKKNMHYWNDKNERRILERKTQGRHSVKVWCGIYRSRIIGPIFFDHNLTSNRYLAMLEHNIQPLIEREIPAWERDQLIWQQDGAPYHKGHGITRFLNEHYHRWIGVNGALSWPARSPDLTPLDFFLWGALKDIVYKQRLTTANEVRRSIQEAVEYLNRTNCVSSAIEHLETIYTTCIVQNGGHIENLL